MESVLALLGYLGLAFLLANIQSFGLTSLLISSTSLGTLGIFFSQFTENNIQILDNFLVSGSIACFYLAYCNRHKHKHEFAFHKKTSSKWLIISIILLAIAHIKLGIHALILPGIVIIPFLWWLKDLRSFIQDSTKELLIGWGCFFIINLSFYYSNFTSSGEYFSFYSVQTFLTNKIFYPTEGFHYFAGGEGHSKIQHLLLVPLALIPWSAFGLQALSNFGVYTDPYKPNEGKVPQLLSSFSLWWLIMSLISYLLIGGEVLAHLPGLILPLSIILGKWWTLKFRVKKYLNQNLDALIGLIILSLACIIGLYIAITKYSEELAHFHSQNLVVPIIIVACVIISSSFIAMTSINRQPKISFGLLAVASGFSYFIATIYLLRIL